MFAPQKLVTEAVPPVYSHGYTPEQVEEIKLAKKELEKKPVNEITLEDFKNIVVPFQRIHRTEIFNLNPEKIKPPKKERVVKPKVVREPKEKKMTKKEIEAKITDIIFKKALQNEVTEEEEAFFLLHTNQSLV